MSKNKNVKFKNGLPVKEEVVKEKAVVSEEEVSGKVEGGVSVEEEVVVEDAVVEGQPSNEAVGANPIKEGKEQQKVKSDVKKDNKNAKDKKKANGKAEKRTIAQKTKATVSELKKVTWPTFGQTVKQTGVVIGFVLIFIVILLGLNSLFGWLFNLIIDSLA